MRAKAHSRKHTIVEYYFACAQFVCESILFAQYHIAIVNSISFHCIYYNVCQRE